VSIERQAKDRLRYFAHAAATGLDSGSGSRVQIPEDATFRGYNGQRLLSTVLTAAATWTFLLGHEGYFWRQTRSLSITAPSSDLPITCYWWPPYAEEL
jgi:hypothetical protein